ncbi:MAG TPA: cupin domain-containing protein [Candidatus Binatus sp.]|uniref:cupin domain-containing protein n=1 Tax=Candidatus Binatus sp. TaxID=2811406 RepID=UPI002F412974
MVTDNGHRRVVTGHRSGKSVVLSDQHRELYKFKTVAGFEHTYMWSTNGTLESDPDKVEQELPKSALPSADGSLLHIVTFPPAKAAASSTSDPSQIAQEYLTRLPGLADTFERDGSQMHVTQTVDYAILLAGELWLELDDGETVHLVAGDIVVQQATRHGWRNKGEHPATIAFVMLGAGPPQE